MPAPLVLIHPTEIVRWAEFSTPGFRAVLGRRWNTLLPMCMFVGLNPGRADDKDDDATARKYIGFARRWGFGGYLAYNLFQWVATDPQELIARIRAGEPVNQPDPDAHMRARLTPNVTVCFAWGNPPPHVFFPWRDRVLEIERIVYERASRSVCAAMTKAGHPAHLSRLPYTDAPLEWRP